MVNFLTKILSTKQERDIKRLKPYVVAINALAPKIAALSDAELQTYTKRLQTQVQTDGKTLKSILPETFALVREAAKRTIKLRHFDEQLMGGIALFEGNIAEMKTGEGKTLVAPLTATLRAISGKSVHIVTVNDHLAKRDAEWMRPVYERLGLSVGFVVHNLPYSKRKTAYNCDITYATNNELGFDYLRDNMAVNLEEKVQRGHHFCLIDEVDSILIDEARTPLIISGPSETNTQKYYTINRIIPQLKEAERGAKGIEVIGTGDYTIDLKDRNVIITEDGVKRLETLLNISNLYNSENNELLHHISQGLKAHKLFTRNVDYIVEDGCVQIIDEFTGRKMEGRRFSDGLHQAIEAKENVNILSENQTIATITLQNYFRMYETIAGMTGTADTEAEEFSKIYKLEVIVIPTHMPVVRVDRGDKIFRTEREKFNAITTKIKEEHLRGRPILIGTASVDKSENLSKLLIKRGLPHELLNAKNHEREAQIVEKAGAYGSITIATNMAGRGTDIKLVPETLKSGGLLVIGSERHEARRIDNQLRGRSGRQGDAGETIFYLSLEDTLMRRFHSERISKLMLRLGMREGEQIEHPLITRQIENAQRKVESRNFELRKHLLEYDDVMNTQRSFIYKERNILLESTELLDELKLHIEEVIEQQLLVLADGDKKPSDELYKRLQHWMQSYFLIPLPVTQAVFLKSTYENIETELKRSAHAAYEQKRATYTPAIRTKLERFILLRILDHKWKEHLLSMDHLREGISLRAYGERRPLIEFKREGFRLFKELVIAMRYEAIEALFKVRVESSAQTAAAAKPSPTQTQYTNSRTNIFADAMPEADAAAAQTAQTPMQTTTATQIATQAQQRKMGRNEPCHCGSGKKYKHCHGLSS